MRPRRAVALAPYEIILVTRERTPFPPSLVARLPQLKMFGLTGSRAALIDIAGMISRGITVCYTDGGPGVSATAENGAGPHAGRSARHSCRRRRDTRRPVQEGTRAGMLLDGKTVGIIGLGRIGTRMASYCLALGMRVLAWSQNLTAERATAAGATHATKDELLANSDVVSPAPCDIGAQPRHAGSS